MINYVPQAPCRRRSASQPIIGQSLIWASVMIGSAILLRGTPAEDGMLLILLSGATTSIVLMVATCRRLRQESGRDGESRD